MKVWHVNDIASVGPTIVTSLRKLGVDAEFIDIPKPFANAPWVIKLLGLPLRIWFARRLLKKARRQGVDLLHIHYSSAAPWFIYGGVPVVVHCHGDDVRLKPWNLIRHAFNFFVFKKASAIFFSTPDMAKSMKFYTAGAKFLPNPVDVQTFDRAIAERDPQFVFLHASLDHIKGADLAIEAIKRLKPRYPSLRFVAVRQGTYINEAKQAGIELIERMSRPELANLQGRAGLILGQFRLGAVGLSELETLAIGRTIACHFSYGSLFASQPPFVQAHTVEEIVEVLEKFVKDPRAYLPLETGAREWVLKFHDPDAIAQQVQDAYKTILPNAALSKAREGIRKIREGSSKPHNESVRPQ